VGGAYAPGATSDGVIALFAGGVNVNGVTFMTSSEKYDYTSFTRSTSTSLGLARYYPVGVGNATVGIFGGGRYSNYSPYHTAYTDKYTYSNNTVAAGTALSSVKCYHAAAGNSAKGVYFGGQDDADTITKNTILYQYSNNAVTIGTVLTNVIYAPAATGNSISGVFIYGSITEKYNYATNAVTPGTALGVFRQYAAGCSSSPGGF
jgi:hypothetical protein